MSYASGNDTRPSWRRKLLLSAMICCVASSRNVKTTRDEVKQGFPNCPTPYEKLGKPNVFNRNNRPSLSLGTGVCGKLRKAGRAHKALYDLWFPPLQHSLCQAERAASFARGACPPLPNLRQTMSIKVAAPARK
uniref:Putative secreted protein n=1 Tax=Ixodes ricinus TaxID=34613 RepID=A0A147BR97_IXORI